MHCAWGCSSQEEDSVSLTTACVVHVGPLVEDRSLLEGTVSQTATVNLVCVMVEEIVLEDV